MLISKILLFTTMVFFIAPNLASAVVPPDNPNCPGVISTYKANKGAAISCKRTRARQLQIVAYNRKRGRPGQASKNSNHIIGCACDYTSRSLVHRNCLWYNGKGHTGNHCSKTGR